MTPLARLSGPALALVRIAVLAVMLPAAALPFPASAHEPPRAQASIPSERTATDTPAAPPAFRVAEGTRTWVFPRDHGQHPEYALEWWYYTGFLTTVPATENNTALATADSTVLATADSTVPATADSTVPATENNTAPATADSTVPATENNTAPATADNTTSDTAPATEADRPAPAAQSQPPAPRVFGFQVTFFRQGLRPDAPPAGSSAWRAQSLYLAHVALSDLTGRRFFHEGRTARGSLSQAGAATARQRVWVGNWQSSSDATHAQPHAVRLEIPARDFQLSLTLQAKSPPILHGAAGLDQKGPARGQASWYYSLPRLHGVGELILTPPPHNDPDSAKQTRLRIISAQVWMDHEFGTNQLAANQAGWDWFAFRLPDGSDLMLYRLRLRDPAQHNGATPHWQAAQSDAFSHGSWRMADGTQQRLVWHTAITTDNTAAADTDSASTTPLAFRLTPLRSWQSPHNGADYPLWWRLEIPAKGLRLQVSPLLEDQELQRAEAVFFPYWEGAVKAEGMLKGAPVVLQGYMELTGYAGALGDFF